MNALEIYLINNNLMVNSFARKAGLKQPAVWRINEPAKQSLRI